MASTSRGANPVALSTGFFTGVGFLLRGLRMYARSPRLMLLGLVPAVISGVVLVAAFVAMVIFVDDVVTWATPFADDWTSALRQTVRVVAMIAVAGVWTVLSFLVFTALTLLIGQPFYEAISKRVEDRLGGIPDEIDVSFWRSLPRTVGDSLRLMVFSLGGGVVIFLLGLIPLVGQVAAAVLGALLGGWVLALELTSVPFERRGLRFADRRRALRQRRPMALGFGVATFVCFLIPLGAVLVMPAAVAGATLLSRRLFNQPDAEAT
ncbi:MAG TPA: EI24 domain-containing protein [Micromonosporaceae bacterium]